ncbi:unnamed protein product [Soboliphyme baturini]|uniref:Slingshot N-terminal domain-containing protein n=1 Tax=Soboliphyme baturini TaxID=241478 RepID=A0A183IZI1_9BILA|nr:unnamed protein product [Soboliphyme baturini]
MRPIKYFDLISTTSPVMQAELPNQSKPSKFLRVGLRHSDVIPKELQKALMITETASSKFGVRLKPSKGKALVSRSSSEYYFAVRGAAVILPKNEFQLKRETCNGGEIKQHLQSMLQLLRPRDTLRMAVRLQNMFSNYTRYLVIISTSTRHDNRESSLLGIDYITPNQPAIALILPIWANTAVKLDGDGGISFESSDSYHLFKPISVQAMW